MKYLLSTPCRDVLRTIAEEETLCAFDFDGTLAPIVDHPADVRLRSETAELLKEVARVYPCVILSGRAGDDLAPRVAAIPLKAVIGNHGAESQPVSREMLSLVRGWKSAIAGTVDSLPGAWVEDKGLSLAIHYRQSPDREEAEARILAATSVLARARVFGGKQVVNVVYEHAPHKGDALAAERDRRGCTWVLYVGDDENDEDAFMLEGNTVAVRVGMTHDSRARYYLKNQFEIDQLLRILLELRSAEPTGPVCHSNGVVRIIPAE